MKNLSEQEELYYELSDIAHEMKIRVSDLIIVAKELEFGEVKPDDLFTLSEAKQLIARYDEKQNKPEKVPEKKDKGLLKKLRTKKDELFAPKNLELRKMNCLRLKMIRKTRKLLLSSMSPRKNSHLKVLALSKVKSLSMARFAYY